MHKVYIVGAGPGDPELLTIKAKKLITNYADIVIHDRLISKEILKIIPKKVKKIFAGKEPECHHMKQDEINNALVKYAKLGKKVVRLKGGDPFIFGRGGEEAKFLKNNRIKFEVVAGITAAVGAAADLNLPLTYRGLSDGIVFLTGHNYEDNEPDLDYEFLAKTKNTLVFYMAVKNINIIAEKLIESGKDPKTKCLAISNANSKSSKKLFAELKNLAKKMSIKNIKNPALIYIGDVVKISQALN